MPVKSILIVNVFFNEKRGKTGVCCSITTIKMQSIQTTMIHDLLMSKLKTYIYKDARIF